jgi:hypothetical protein
MSAVIQPIHLKQRAEAVVIKREQVMDNRIRQLSAQLNIDFEDLKAFLMRFVPLIRETVIVILEQMGWLPVATQQQTITTHGIQVYQDAGVGQVAGMYGLDQNFLKILFERVGPILANILLELLRNVQPMVAMVGNESKQNA